MIPASLNPNEELQGLYGEVSEWVRERLSTYSPTTVREQKIIRDAVHGFQPLYRHEVALIDSPVFQRLRYIHQTALAHLVYPTMRHTRFDHSLGMLLIATKMIEALRQKYPSEISAEEVQLVRLAALFHDLGHTIFSHLGETVLESRFGTTIDAVKKAKHRDTSRFFERADAGEILSYVIVTCEPFLDFINQRFADYRGAECLLQEQHVFTAAGLVVGRVDDPVTKQYLVEIINGSFDSDKLEYLSRDCHFSGIKAEIDVPRILHSLDWIRTVGQLRHLTVDTGVVPQLEQLLMAKMLLFSSVYHHHKVLALECMTRAVFEALDVHAAQLKHRLLRFERISDFLRVREFEFFSWTLEEEPVHELIDAIIERHLIKRALVVSKHTVTPESQNRITRLRSSIPTVQAMSAVRKTIFDKIPPAFQTTEAHLWLAIPKGPEVDHEADHIWVRTGSDPPLRLSEILPYIKGWVEAYVAHKLTNYVFYDSVEANRRQAAEAATQYLKSELEIEVTQEALRRAHL